MRGGRAAVRGATGDDEAPPSRSAHAIPDKMLTSRGIERGGDGNPGRGE